MAEHLTSISAATAARPTPSPSFCDDSPLTHASPSRAAFKRFSAVGDGTNPSSRSPRRSRSLTRGPLEEEEQETDEMLTGGTKGASGERRKSVGLGLRFGMEGFLDDEEDEEYGEETETGREASPFHSPKVRHSAPTILSSPSSVATSPPSSPNVSRSPGRRERHSTYTTASTTGSSPPMRPMRSRQRPQGALLSRCSGSSNSTAATSVHSRREEEDDDLVEDDFSEYEEHPSALLTPSYGNSKKPFVPPPLRTPDSVYESYDFPLPPSEAGAEAASVLHPAHSPPLVRRSPTTERERQLEAAAASFSAPFLSTSVFTTAPVEGGRFHRPPRTHALEPWQVDPFDLSPEDADVLGALLPVAIDSESEEEVKKMGACSPRLVPNSMIHRQKPSVSLAPGETLPFPAKSRSSPSLVAPLNSPTRSPSRLGNFLNKSPSFSFNSSSNSKIFPRLTSPSATPLIASNSPAAHFSPQPSSAGSNSPGKEKKASKLFSLGGLGRSRSKSTAPKLGVVGEGSLSRASSRSPARKVSGTRSLSPSHDFPSTPSPVASDGSPMFMQVLPSSKAAKMMGLDPHRGVLVPSPRPSPTPSPQPSPRPFPQVGARPVIPGFEVDKKTGLEAQKEACSFPSPPRPTSPSPAFTSPAAPPTPAPVWAPPSRGRRTGSVASISSVSTTSSSRRGSFSSSTGAHRGGGRSGAFASRVATKKAAQMLGVSEPELAAAVKAASPIPGWAAGGRGRGRGGAAMAAKRASAASSEIRREVRRVGMPQWPSKRESLEEWEIAASDLYKLSTTSATLLRGSKAVYSPRFITLTRSSTAGLRLSMASTSSALPSASYAVHSYSTRALSELETSRLVLSAHSVVCAPAEGEAPSIDRDGRAFAIKISGSIDALAKDGTARVERRPGTWILGLDDQESWTQWMKSLRAAVSELKGEEAPAPPLVESSDVDSPTSSVFPSDVGGSRLRFSSLRSGTVSEGARRSVYNNQRPSLDSSRPELPSNQDNRTSFFAPSEAYSIYSLDSSHSMDAHSPAIAPASTSHVEIALGTSFLDADSSDEGEADDSPVSLPTPVNPPPRQPSISHLINSTTNGLRHESDDSFCITLGAVLPPPPPPPSSFLPPPPPPGQQSRLSYASYGSYPSSVSGMSRRASSVRSNVSATSLSMDHLNPMASRSRLSVYSLESGPPPAPSGPAPSSSLPPLPPIPASPQPC